VSAAPANPAPAASAVPPQWRVRINIVVGRVLFGLFYRVTTVGRDRVPKDGPVLFVGNHVGVLDGPMLPALSPRPTSMLVKRELFTGLLGWFLAFIGHIPVTRNSGDRSALSAAVAILRAGGAVGIFPEGTRGRGDVSAVQQGAAWLALQGGAVVVPVAFLGTRSTGASTGSLPRLGTRMVVEFGHPVRLAAGTGLTGRARLATATGQLRELLATHVSDASVRHQLALPEDDGVAGRS
jgi:1-acyl-sn-glycerol-3-phosphate acyltransferase